MRSFLLSSVLILFCFAIINVSYGQVAKQYTIFEHFTNTSCGPCATQNPIFQSNILDNNDGTVHHISYHPWWPSNQDPMYVHNIDENTARTQYYGVGAVPTMILRGNQWTGGPAGVSSSLIQSDIKDGSPLRVKVIETINGSQYDLSILLESVNTIPGGTYVLHTAIIESNKTYPSPPGNNGETYFPNIFRKLISGVGGDTVVLASMGNSITKNLSYTMDPAWDANKIYVIAFVQNLGTKEVINSGSTLDPDFEILNNSADIFKKSPSGSEKQFSTHITVTGNSQNMYRIKLESEQPGNWNSGFVFNGNTYPDSVDVQLNGGFTGDIDIKVTPGNTPAVGSYSIQVSQVNNTNFQPQNFNYHVISGITDLIINNEESFGDGSFSYDFEPDYRNGLTAAGNTAYDAIGHNLFMEGMDKGILDEVNNLYYNVGWSFPSFTDEKVAAFKPFLDNGGNLFVSGQDIGWDTWDPNGNGNANTQDFYTNYLQAAYLNDGGVQFSQLTANPGDQVFGNVSSSNISDVYIGNFYPDQIRPTNLGKATFNYNGDTNIVGGVRYEAANFKTVYLGIGIEMIQSQAVRDSVIKLSHDWFYGITTGTDFQNKLNAAINGYPNPAKNEFIISIQGLERRSQLFIMDINGRIVTNKIIESGDNIHNFDVSDLPQGLYHYVVKSDNNQELSKTFTVIK